MYSELQASTIDIPSLCVVLENLLCSEQDHQSSSGAAKLLQGLDTKPLVQIGGGVEGAGGLGVQQTLGEPHTITFFD